MRVPSYSSSPARRSPQQDRSARRVGAFLEAAEALFAELGFEGATMTAMAERAGSSIGALYSYFPDKKSIAIALLDSYAGHLEEHWKPLFQDAGIHSSEEFAEQFIDRFLDFIAGHPAYLELQAAPIRLRRSTAARRAFRASLADALQLRAPALSREAAELCANVMVQIVRGMKALYAETPPAGRPAVVREFKKVLAAYMKTVFLPSHAG